MLIVGTAALGQVYGGSHTPPTLAEIRAFFNSCRTQGVTSFDTAPGYGSAEIRTFSFAPPGLIDTKISRIDPEVSIQKAQTLYTDQIDRLHSRALTSEAAVRFIHLHSVDNLTSHGGQLFDFHLKVASRFRLRGTQAAAGVSIYSPQDMEQAVAYQSMGLKAIQFPFNILSTEWHKYNFSKVTEAKLIVRSVFLQGLLAKWGLISWPEPASKRMYYIREELSKIQKALGRDSIMDLCLAFVRGKFAAKTCDLCLGVNDWNELAELLLLLKLPPLYEDEVTYTIEQVAKIDIPQNLTDPRKWKV